MRTSREDQVISNLNMGNDISDLSRIDADLLFDLFRRHRLFPIVDEVLLSLLDDETQDSWRKTIKVMTLRSLQLTGVLEGIVKSMDIAGIEQISFKGPVLAMSLYGDPGKRHFIDLDLAIQRKELQKALGVLEDRGFVMTYPKAELSSKQWDYYFKHKKDVGLVNRDVNVFIELHVGIYYHEILKSSDERLIWEDPSFEIIGGTPVRCFNRDNTFLYLLYHGGVHLYFRLFWLRDIAEAIKRWDLDHREILKKARALGIERLIGLGILLAKDFFGIDIPEAYNAYIKGDSKRLNRLKEMCIKRIYGPELDTPAMKFYRHSYFLSYRSDLRYKWAVLSTIYHRWYIKNFLGGH